jgi:hypothetical protein
MNVKQRMPGHATLVSRSSTERPAREQPDPRIERRRSARRRGEATPVIWIVGAMIVSLTDWARRAASAGSNLLDASPEVR